MIAFASFAVGLCAAAHYWTCVRDGHSAFANSEENHQSIGIAKRAEASLKSAGRVGNMLRKAANYSAASELVAVATGTGLGRGTYRPVPNDALAFVRLEQR